MPLSKTIRPWLLAAGFGFAAALQGAVLPKPEGLAVDTASGAQISWEAVEGAVAYRVAVFDAAEADGKRPLLAAVWVSGTAWTYGKAGTLAKFGKLPSTKPMPLPAGRTLRVMVAAAREDGADKSEWSGEDFSLAAEAKSPQPTATPTLTPEPVVEGSKDEEAELELEGGEEFKRSPEPAVIELEEGAAAAAPAAAASVAGSVASAAAPAAAQAAPEAAPASEAAAPSDNEAKYRDLLKKDSANPDHWEGLGDALLAKRMKAEAHEAYSQALMLDGSREHLREWIKKNVPRR